MVCYSIDTKVRDYVIYFLAIASVSIAYVLIEYLPAEYSPPSVMAIFGSLYWLFGRHLWKIPIVNQALGIPDLNGDWQGKISRRDVEKGVSEADLEVRATISQTWSRINLVLVNSNAESTSGPTMSFTKAASLSIQDPKAVVLRDIFQYRDAQGMSELRLREDGDALALEGHYCSTAMRIGNIVLVRQ